LARGGIHKRASLLLQDISYYNKNPYSGGPGRNMTKHIFEKPKLLLIISTGRTTIKIFGL